MKITDDDAAFILGKGGRTKEKISKVSGGEPQAPGDGKGWWPGGVSRGMLGVYHDVYKPESYQNCKVVDKVTMQFWWLC